MISGDLIALLVTWTVIVTIALILRKSLGRDKVEIYYGIALIVRGKTLVNRLLEKAAKPLNKIPLKVLTILLVGTFSLTMLFFVPIPLLIVPGAPKPLFAFDHLMLSGTVLLLRNLVLGINYIASKLTPLGLVEQGFLTLQPLIPGFTISFKAFILILIAIGISILVHEIAHGVVARRLNIPAKSGGFFTSFLVLFGGFVELDESELEKRRLEEKLAVFSAGVVANILLGLTVLIIYLLLAQLTNLTGFPLGLVVSYSQIAGIHRGDVIVKIGNYYVHNTLELLWILPNLVLERPSKVKVLVLSGGTLRETYIDISKLGLQSLLNVSASLSKVSLLGGKLILKNTLTYEALFWLLVLNMTLAMLNALPAYPLDGGLIVQTVLEEVMSRDKARMVTYIVSGLFWALLALSIFLTFESHLYVFVS